MAINTAATAMNHLKDNGQADLKLSPETRDAYLQAITDLRTALESRVREADGVGEYGNPGKFASAQQTKANLELAVANFKTSVNDYIEFLDAFAETVKKSADRLMNAG